MLAENPNLNDADAEKLDSIIKRRFNGKSLVPFVFEELICAWETKLQNMEAKWSQMNKEAATLKRQIKELEVKMQIESLTSNEEVQLVDLKMMQKILLTNLINKQKKIVQCRAMCMLQKVSFKF